MMNQGLEVFKELLVFIRDFWSPEKRKLNFKLHLDKRAYRKIETAEEYIHTNQQFRGKVNGLINMVELKNPELITPEEKKALYRLNRYLDKYEKVFRRL